ncbi:MAG: peptidoglycan-binding protein [Hyphomicrobiales bacterium]|nr:peptidoglycan-binding protein [Hyphomicrobiales bacterium]
MRRRLNLDLAATIAIAAGGVVWINALWLQDGRHPAPLFAAAPPASPSQFAEKAPVQTRVEASPEMRELQRGLRDLGFYDGAVDGIDGPRTRMAIAAYQKAIGLNGTGRADEGLYRQVRLARRDVPPVPPMPPAPPASDSETRLLAVQQVLADLGYAPGRIDGRLGSNTQAAIARFERDHGLKVTGQMSAALVRKLSAVSGVALDKATGPPIADNHVFDSEPER